MRAASSPTASRSAHARRSTANPSRPADRQPARLGAPSATARATAAESTDRTPVVANARTRSSNRSSKRVMSSIAKLRSKSAEQSRQPSAGAGGADAAARARAPWNRSPRRSAARRAPGRPGSDAGEGIAEVDVAGTGAWVRACGRGGSPATEISSTRPRRRRRDSCRASLTAIEMSHGRRRSGSRIVSSFRQAIGHAD